MGNLTEFQLGNSQKSKKSFTIVPEDLIIGWRAPLNGCFKLNVDAALNIEKGFIGLAAVIRNHRGEGVCLASSFIHQFLDPTSAEALALLFGVRLAVKKGFQLVEVESDSKSLIEDVKKKGSISSTHGAIVGEIRRSAREDRFLSLSFVPRTSNKVAHEVAHWACNSKLSLEWVEDFPPWIEAVLYDDIVHAFDGFD